MRLANGIGSVYKLSGNRRNPYIVRKTTGGRLTRIAEKQMLSATQNAKN